MTMMIKARNVNEAFSNGFFYLRAAGQEEGSRNGRVVVAPGPVLTTYTHPTERVLWDERRLANPFFHLAECAWMLSGGMNVDWIAQFNSRMREYAEKSGAIHGAYGARWRSWFGVDQVMSVYNELANRPQSRRAVISMWDPGEDRFQYNDIPCNTTIYFRVRDEDYLDMTVCCRSNDILWGAYGANVVHMSFLQEVLAQALGHHVGHYHQFSNNYHAYVETAQQFLESPPIYDEMEDPYVYSRAHRPFGLWMKAGQFGIEQMTEDCAAIVHGDRVETLSNPFVKYIMHPMLKYYLGRRVGKANINIIDDMPDCDWKQAALLWIKLKEESRG